MYYQENLLQFAYTGRCNYPGEIDMLYDRLSKGVTIKPYHIADLAGYGLGSILPQPKPIAIAGGFLFPRFGEF